MARPTFEDLQAALSGVEPGEYRTAQLLPVYLEWAGRKGRSPIDAKTLGECIWKELCLESRKTHGGANVWILTREGLECRNWYKRD